MKDLSYIRKPTIAMLNGVAAGFGMDMALQCDIRYGSEQTRFISYQQVGQIIENGGAYYLTRLAGLGRALEFAFTGHLDGETAAEWGVVNKLVPSDQLEAEVRVLCDRIMRNPPMVTWINKRVIRAAMDSTLETTSVLTSNASAILATSEDAAEARAALRERAPRIQGPLSARRFGGPAPRHSHQESSEQVGPDLPGRAGGELFRAFPASTLRLPTGA